ncbi:hypothetical protein [Coxiella-like endosymbiont]|uniref:hypothetical protein n=1 Tax=Coxiella-like endosymbiont TaxID=1592897 RepID=UPI00272BCC88|nr:hypothetical protein [Coxiella-like endosymbiont]
MRAIAFAHGSNDVANTIELLADVVGIVKGGAVLAEARIPFWILLLGGRRNCEWSCHVYGL